MSTSSVTREIIATKNAPSAVGAYSQSVKICDTVYISGSRGPDPAAGNFVKPFPARAAYQVDALPKAARVEIEAIAHVGEITEKKCSSLHMLFSCRNIYCCVEALVPREMNGFVIPQRHETAIIGKICEASNVA
uniref:Uncharacterized protein n=1 Tax=Panagrolaimus sp. PS1159 TaxID=55785 RepID=A0AC35GQG9_9BILA